MSWRHYGLIVLAALSVRMGNILVLQFWPDIDLLNGDARNYWNIAQAITENGWRFVTVTTEGSVIWETERMPLYPYFLAASIHVFGENLIAVQVIQSCLDVCTCLLIAWIASHWSRQAGFAGGLIAAVSPNLIVHSGTILTETLFLFFFAAALAITLSCLKKKSVSSFILLGIFLGLATLTRSITAPLIGVSAIVIIFVLWKSVRDIRRTVILASVVVVSATAVLSPLLLRNNAQFQTLSLSSQTGTHLLLWVVPLVEQSVTGESFNTVSNRLKHEINTDIAALGEDANLTNPFEISEFYQQKAFEKLSETKLVTLLAAWTKAAVTNLFAPSDILHPVVREYKSRDFYELSEHGMIARAIAMFTNQSAFYSSALILGVAGTLVLNFLSVWGLVILALNRPGLATLAVCFILYFCLINGPVLSPKYRIPFEPILIVLAAISLTRFTQKKPLFSSVNDMHIN